MVLLLKDSALSMYFALDLSATYIISWNIVVLFINILKYDVYVDIKSK